VLTEVLRLIVDNNFYPQKTLKFMAFAGEEGGMLGSAEIAADYKKRNIQVDGDLQLDMTNYKGDEFDVVIYNDNSGQAQNAFVGKLIDTYLKVPWEYERCGYGCSDHNSWNAQGFQATFPFEGDVTNPYYHTINDTLEKSGGNALHSMLFLKLAIAYMVEMDYLK
ncbi:MAG: M28 family peptidase, partial [Pseudomonadota bacterium]